jgi:EmrB/QacA subfamily drug resistance transporter
MSNNATSVRLPFAALVLAMLPAVLDQTILSTGLPTIARDLGNVTDVSWLVSAYVVAATAATPLWGKLGDRHGHKRMLEVTVAWFVAASALCGAAQTLTELVIFRAVQGVAAGGLMTLAMAAVSGLVSPRERGRYMGYVAAVFAGATALGPLVGGLIVEHASWRWVFFVNLPIGAAALVGLATRVPSPSLERPQKPFDTLGATLLAGATSAFLLTCLWGGDRFAWDSAPIIALIAATVALSVAVVLRERRAADPIVPLRLLSTRAVAVASTALFFSTAALFAITVFIPLFLQVATGATPVEAGLLLVPMMLGVTLSTTLAGRAIERTGRYKRFPIAGLALMTGGLVLLAALTGQRSIAATAAGILVFGLGFGLVTQVLVTAVQNAVDRPRLGIATAATNFFRALGGAAGAAILGAVFKSAGGADAQSVADGVQVVFLVAAPLAAIALLVVLRLPEVELRSQRGAPSPSPRADRAPHLVQRTSTAQ